MRRIAVGAALLAGVAVVVSARQPAEPRGRLRVEQLDGRTVAAGEILFKLRDHALPGDVDAISRLADAESIRTIGRSGVRHLRSRGQTTRALLARLANQPAILYAEPNFIVRALVDPPDPLMPHLWGLQNVGQSVNGGAPGTGNADIQATDAWDISFGSQSHVVGVVDTGVDYTHPDLAPNMWSAPAPFTVTIGGVPITCPAGSHGFNAIAFSCDPMDDHDHGTHVAGTIGAAAGNGIGVVGVNWVASIMALKFIDSTGSGTVADAIAAIDFAIQARHAFAATGAADVRVLSNSWGSREYSQALADEIVLTHAEDMLFVAAAGNDGFSNDLLPLYPASYDVPNVVAVAATTNTDSRAWFSNYGAVSVDLGAPGVDILSTVRGNQYEFLSGTSMATPHVAGAATLVLSRCDLGAVSLKDTLMATAEPVSALASMTVSGGRLDVNSAMHSCLGPPATPAGLTATGGDGRVTLAWSKVVGATSIAIKRSVTSGGPYTAIAMVSASSYVDTSVVNDTTYFYVVSAANSLGASPDSAEATATPKAPSDLVVSSLTLPLSGGAGATVVVTETTRNQGGGRSVPTTTRYYLSRNTLLDASDVPLEPGHAVPALAPGAADSASVSVLIPPSTEAGSYFLIAKADGGGIEIESSEANNVAARLINVGPDLVVSSITAPATAGAGATISVADTVRNQGGGSAGASTTRFYLSTNTTLDAADTLLSGQRSVAGIAAGGTNTGTTSVVIPSATSTGAYYLLAKADADGTVLESQETNNTMARQVSVGGDLVVSTLTVPSGASAGGSISIVATTTNQGSSAVTASTTRFYLSTNTLVDESDVLLTGTQPVGALPPGGASTSTATVTLPASLATGTYYVLARADADNVVFETNEANNVTARSVAVGPDLRMSSVTATPFEVARGGTITVNDTVQNGGAAPAPPSATRFYLSTDLLLNAGDLLLEPTRAVPALAAGAASSGSTPVVIPASVAPGTYYLFAAADGDAAVVETLENNNTAARAVKVVP